ncbi:MAG: glucose-6-phosphate isomerase [Chloroflexota bacterium]|nr:glucose-6-phosphate isomerase [Chloroflexota bacterium]
MSASLGTYTAEVEKTLASLSQQDMMGRIWRKDYTVWKPQPTEITDRLGWLTVTDLMRKRIPAFQSFTWEIKIAGFRHVVLLGMGGSSLGAEVLRQVFGRAPGYPELIVLDSVVPAAVQAVTKAIDPQHTLFLVSSKSGTTTEPLTLFLYFQNLVAARAGKKQATQNFVAITDPGTPLANTAEEEGFRQVFLNPPDIGGRYSVLSYFGLVPAALLGVDISALLDHADRARESCASSVPARENPAAWLGAYLGTLARQGRDKLTLITSPSLSSFGLWVEQLVAESTGKEGKGIIPVVGEPLTEPASYSDDRLFVYLRREDDNNAVTDAAVESLKSAGQPVVIRKLAHHYELGAEFFQWELATAVAGAILGINPFDQPDVQQAKDATQHFLHKFAATGRPFTMSTSGHLGDLLVQSREGKYLAIMAYLRQSPELDGLLTHSRRKIVERYHIATTLGYGPRFLHSTGQLHKGGPNTGLFLQITAAHGSDLPIPGQPYTFGTVADAQALGDFEALQAAHRQIVRIHCPQDSERAVVTCLAGELGV